MMKQPDMSKASIDDYCDFEDLANECENNDERLNKSPSIAYFEAVCSFWRTFYWLSESTLLPNMKPNVSAKLQNFVQNEGKRLKIVCADVGAMLAAFTVFQKSVSDNTAGFIDAYLDEVFLRCVMWWQKAIKTPSATPQAVFAATTVSRDITLFQLMFLKHVIGDNLSATAHLLDQTNGKAPKVLEQFQQAWKESKRKVCDWRGFLEQTGCSMELIQSIASDEDKWVRVCVARARNRGKMYGF